MTKEYKRQLKTDFYSWVGDVHKEKEVKQKSSQGPVGAKWFEMCRFFGQLAHLQHWIPTQSQLGFLTEFSPTPHLRPINHASLLDS